MYVRMCMCVSIYVCVCMYSVCVVSMYMCGCVQVCKYILLMHFCEKKTRPLIKTHNNNADVFTIVSVVV